MDDIRHQPPQNPPAGMPADSRTGFPAPKFTGSTAILFCVLSLVPSAVAAAMGEYGFGLFLLSVAAGFSALPLFCGGKYTAAAVIPWVLSAGLSLGLRPERPWFALFVLSFAFLASALAIGGRRRFSRTRLTAVAAGTLAVFLAAAFFLYLFLRFGGVGFAALNAFRDALVTQFTETVQYVNESYRLSLREIGSASALALLETVPSDAQVAQTVREAAGVLSGILPGLLLALCCCLAHFSSFLFCYFGKYYGKALFASPGDRTLCIALPGAVLFYLGAIFTVFGGEGLLSTSFVNFFFIYLPGFILMGAQELLSGRKRHGGRQPGGFLLPLLLVIGFFLNPLLLPVLLALVGASVSVRAAILRAGARRRK